MGRPEADPTRRIAVDHDGNGFAVHFAVNWVSGGKSGEIATGHV